MSKLTYNPIVKKQFDDLNINYQITKVGAYNRAIFHGDETSIGKLWLQGKPKEKCGSQTCWLNENNIFYGQSTDEWERAVQGDKVDMRSFKEAEAKSAKMISRLQDKLIQVKPMRKRRMSEYDGEFCFDRQYEITPFNGTYMTNQGIARSMVINADFSISAQNSAEDIATYGALIYGIIASLESCGITCEVNIEWTTQCELYDGQGLKPFQQLGFNVNVKKAGQYISEERLARSFSVGQYRRSGFGLMNYATCLYGWRIDSGLGRPTPDTKRLLSLPGILNFYPDDPQKLSPEKVLEAVEKALGI